MKKPASLFCTALMVMGLAGCAGTIHDNIYGDDTAIAGEDKHGTQSFTGAPNGEGVYHFTVAHLSGAETIWHFYAEGGEAVNIQCSLEETAGGFVKLTLVDPAGTVTTLVEASSGSDKGEFSFTAGGGLYRIKLVGKGNPGITGQLAYSHGSLGAAGQ